MFLLFITCFTFISFPPKVFSKSHNRIVNGTDSSIKDFPFMVSLRIFYYNNHFCGGSILSETWILTAAHCAEDFRVQDIDVQYGVTEITADKHNTVKVKSIVMHPEYDKNNALNDLAVIELEDSLEFGASVQSVTLPKPNEEVAEGTDVVAAGWGRDQTDGYTQTHLKSVHLTIASYKTCRDLLGSDVHRTNICAGFPRGYKGICYGDSGGPLLADNVLVGVASWIKKPCGGPPKPSVFMKVSAYVEWIKTHINKTKTK